MFNFIKTNKFYLISITWLLLLSYFNWVTSLLLSPVDIMKKHKDAVALISTDNSLSTGFVISKYGHIACAAHAVGVVKSTVTINFIESDHNYVGVVVKKSRRLDVAVIQVPNTPSNILPLKLNNDPMYDSGILLTTIGHPEGLVWSVASGNLSRDFIMKRRFLQVTVPINHGNSGGPLFNDKGEVIGMVHSTLTNTQGIGFVIPSEIISVVLRGTKGYVN